MKAVKIIHWVLTGLFALAMLNSAYMYLTHNEYLVGGMKHLGYPLYLLNILGTAKLLGVLALLQWRFPVLREWAYAGFTINLIGAVWSHAALGDPVAMVAVFLVVLIGSYVTWKWRARPVTRLAGA